MIVPSATSNTSANDKILKAVLQNTCWHMALYVRRVVRASNHQEDFLDPPVVGIAYGKEVYYLGHKMLAQVLVISRTSPNLCGSRSNMIERVSK
jgi:hypothetical protein